MKALINIKNGGNKCFLLCHVRHLNQSNKNPQRLTTKYKKLVDSLDYKGINFSISKKNHKKIEQKNNICINVFFYENGLTYPAHISKQKFEDYMHLLLIIDENKSKVLTNLCSVRQNITLLQILFTMF